MTAETAQDDQEPNLLNAAVRVKLWQRWLAFAVVLGISLAIVLLRKQLANLGAYGYPGLFLVSLVSSATVLLPAPSLAVVFAAGTTLSPPLIGVAAGTGEALGEITGYLAGLGGSTLVENQSRYEQMRGWMQRWGLSVIFVLSLIPNPFFDLAGICAGAMRVPVWQFLAVCWVGKVIKATVVAFTGLQVIGLVERSLH